MGKKNKLTVTQLMNKTVGKRKKRRDKLQGKKNRKAQSRAAQKAFEKRNEALGPVPKSFVFRRGVVGESVKKLVQDMRHVMMPETALHLRERKANTLKDFVHAAVELDVTHLLCFSTGNGTGNTFLRIGRVPHGPTLTFAVQEFSLALAVQSLRSRNIRAINPDSPELRTAPLVILNNFNAGGQAMHLVSVSLQNMFPSINLDTIRLRECRRVVLFHYDADSDTILFRHYIITAAPSGINRNLRRIVQNKDVPIETLSRARDIADYVLGPAAASESEASDMEDCKVALPQDFVGSGNVAAASPSERSTIRLIEVGPRMTLRLVRVQEELFDGAVLLGTRDKDTAGAEYERVKAKFAATEAAKAAKAAEEEKKNSKFMKKKGKQQPSQKQDKKKEKDSSKTDKKKTGQKRSHSSNAAPSSKRAKRS